MKRGCSDKNQNLLAQLGQKSREVARGTAVGRNHGHWRGKSRPRVEEVGSGRLERTAKMNRGTSAEQKAQHVETVGIGTSSKQK